LGDPYNCSVGQSHFILHGWSEIRFWATNLEVPNQVLNRLPNVAKPLLKTGARAGKRKTG